MAKEVPWFRHDMNARRDPKLVALRRAKGFDGLGRWWVVVEVLREQTYYRLPDTEASYELLSEELHCSIAEARDFMDLLTNNLGLCEKVDGGYIQSPSLIRRMEAWETTHKALSQAGRKGAMARYSARPTENDSQAIATLKEGNSQAIATQSKNDGQAIAMELGDIGEGVELGEEASGHPDSQAKGSQRRAPNGPPARPPKTQNPNSEWPACPKCRKPVCPTFKSCGVCGFDFCGLTSREYQGRQQAPPAPAIPSPHEKPPAAVKEEDPLGDIF